MSTDGETSAFEPGDHDAVPLAMDELRSAAAAELPEAVWDFVVGGAGREETVENNRRAFRDWHLQSRSLRDVSEVTLDTELLGQEMAAPVMLAPIGAQSVFHQSAELGTVRGASAAGVPPVLSTSTTRTMEEIADHVADVPAWFQLYFSRDRELTASLASRAERAGYEAIVVTVDTPTVGWRYRDRQNGFFAPTDGDPHAFANFFSDPVFREDFGAPPETDLAGAFEHVRSIFPDPTATWSDVADLCDRTSLPVLLKGIVHPDDASRALAHGVDGIVVSNHGGRQLDGEIGALRALERVGAAVDGDLPLLLDGGVRSGADVAKALALGADAVFVGRPYVYGLAIDGADGVEAVLRNLLAELETTLAVCGCPSVADLDGDVLVEG